MAGREDAAARRRMWSERLKRFAQGNWTVAEFCRRERVSVPSFYEWRRRLAQAPAPPQRGEVASPQARPAFVPVTIVPQAQAAVELHLPNGVRVCLPAGDVQALAAAIAAAGQLPGRQEDAAC
jgi:hypothetical protein